MADSHLGFDLPLKPRIRRRRRGHDFLANHERALARALEEDVDLVVHGGDVFHRSRVAPSLVHQAFAPLRRVADSGTPVFVVPGNHERSSIPHSRLAVHPGIHLFDAPRTRSLQIGEISIAVSGFPYERRAVRTKFRSLLAQTAWEPTPAQIRLLCIHHCVEGATVGPGNYTFRDGADVIRGQDLPQGFAAVLSGHIHRHQLLTSDLAGQELPVPVVYPGSVERTSIAEISETKGYVILELEPNARGGELGAVEFVRLPARPMVVRELRIGRLHGAGFGMDDWLRRTIAEVPRDAVLRIKVHGPVPPEWDLPSPRTIRSMAPASMNVEVTVLDGSGGRVRAKPSPSPDVGEQMVLPLT